MSITLFFLLCFVFALHFIGDFMLQTHKQATNKSKSIKYLTYHVLTYCLPFFALIALGGLSYNMLYFFLLLFGTHWLTDFFSSKATSYFYRKQDWHNFFVIVGFDQLVHIITLMYLTDIFILGG